MMVKIDKKEGGDNIQRDTPASYTVYIADTCVYELEVHAKNKQDLVEEIERKLEENDIEDIHSGGRKILRIDVDEVYKSGQLRIVEPPVKLPVKHA